MPHCDPQTLIQNATVLAGVIPPGLMPIVGVEVLEEIVDGGGSIFNPFDPGPCQVLLGGVDVVEGGGDTFDCYPNNTTGTPRFAGTGWAELWRQGSSEFLAAGDKFDTYPNGEVVTTLNAQTDPLTFSGAWLDGMSESLAAGDKFDTYPNGEVVTTLDAQTDSLTFSGAWIHGAGP